MVAPRSQQPGGSATTPRSGLLAGAVSPGSGRAALWGHICGAGGGRSHRSLCCPEQLKQLWGCSVHLQWSCCRLEPAQLSLGSTSEADAVLSSRCSARGHAAAAGRARDPRAGTAISIIRCRVFLCTLRRAGVLPPVSAISLKAVRLPWGTFAKEERRKQPGLHLLH